MRTYSVRNLSRLVVSTFGLLIHNPKVISRSKSIVMVNMDRFHDETLKLDSTHGQLPAIQEEEEGEDESKK